MDSPSCAKTRILVLSWCFCVHQALRYSLIRPWTTCLRGIRGGHIGRLAELVQRRSLFPRLVRPMLVVMPQVLRYTRAGPGLPPRR